MSKLEGSTAERLPVEDTDAKEPNIREAGAGDESRDLIELPDELMEEFDQKSAEMSLHQDETLNRHLAIAAEAKREADRINELFKHMEQPYADAWELVLSLRKYDVELEDALYEATERPELQRDLGPARKEREEITTARKQIDRVLKKIQKAVEEASEERTEQRAREEEPDDVGAQLEFMDELGEQAEIRRNLKKGTIDADARGVLELKLQDRAEMIERRMEELNASVDEAKKRANVVAYEVAEKALKDVHETIHALFEEDRRVIREAKEDLEQVTDEEIDDVVERMEPKGASEQKADEAALIIEREETPDREIADALEHMEAGELQRIPANIEGTRAKSAEAASLAERIRGEIARFEDSGSDEIKLFITELELLDNLESELDERLDLLYAKDENTKDERKEFEIIADAKHLIQDLRHEIKSYEQNTPRKDVAAERLREKRAALDNIKVKRLDTLSQEIIRDLKQRGVKAPIEYLTFQSSGMIGNAVRAFNGMFGKKYPMPDAAAMKRYHDVLVNIQSDYEVEYYGAEERKGKPWQKNIRDRSRLHRLSSDADIFELWKTVRREAADLNSKGVSAPETEGVEQTEGENEERIPVSNESIETAEKAGIKDAEDIWNAMIDDPASQDMKYDAPSVLERMAELSIALKAKDTQAVQKMIAEIKEMQEDLTEKMGGIESFNALVTKAERMTEKKRGKKTVKPKAKKAKTSKKRKAKKAA